MLAHQKSGFDASGVIFCAFFTFAAMGFAGTYSGGSGTAEDPYKISTVADWQELTVTSADWNRNFILLNNIDFGGINLTPVAGDTDSSRYGFQGTQFKGIFDGNGHTLRNLSINQSGKDCIGVFGYVGVEGLVQNLSVHNSIISGRDGVGGVAALNSGKIIGCSTIGGSIFGSRWIGGIAGTNNYLIAFCYATCSVDGMSECIGGLVGYNDDIITTCYATGNVKGTLSVGGLVGHNDYSVIAFCYATGRVTGTGNDAGGLAGVNYGTMTSCFWDTQNSGQMTSAGGVGKTTIEMKMLATFTNAGWDFTYGHL